MFLCMGILQVSGQKWHPNPVIAHRGAWKSKKLPENSIAALKEAIRLNCYGSEFDVHMTADGIPVVNHDADLQGLVIERSTYRQLLQKKLSNGERIPTLESYLKEGLKQNKTKLILEIKPSSVSKARGQELAKVCVDLVKKLKAQAWVEYISFDYDILKTLRKLDPQAHIQFLNGDVVPEKIHEDLISGIDYNHSVFKKNPNWISSAKSLKLVTNVWTVNAKEDLILFLNMGVDFITTNEPELLFELLKQKN